MTFAFVTDPARQCDGKERYVDREAAKRSAMSFRPVMSVYRCPHCNEWHIGSKTHRGARPRNRRRR